MQGKVPGDLQYKKNFLYLTFHVKKKGRKEELNKYNVYLSIYLFIPILLFSPAF